ncbi:sodium:proton antiporter [Pedobacter sp. BS3]|uniref:cation:proton antiporter domain-containing protein n=1 Tax=Pedobacter sp. BS3 TaxID=2567937 RepID=UPI0011F05296|nr:cation:proton antiporter [Pedobacter sp. BS3]TZF84611.1 sodium:proton antiporter [Pedobacter sp. BS3]
MIHLPELIVDLGLILAAAGVVTLLFKKIKQPIVLGYIIAGIFVGPHFTLLPTVAEEKSISIWAEIGVIFLLFSLGLEFSFKKLAKVGGAASVTGITEAVSMLLLGYLVGSLMGWSTMDSIFLGGILCVSSTTIIIKAFDELGVKHKRFAKLVFGVLIVDDLVAILLMVLLSTLAVSQQFAGSEIMLSVLKFGFFLVLWFLGGIFLVPTFLKRTRKLMNDETMLIVSLALCLLMVMLAVKVGFSPALGAFIMGSILAETTQAEHIEHLTKSVKDLFAAVFFVSVGMLIDPQVLVEHAATIIIVVLVTIAGKFLSSSIGALVAGQPLKVAIQAGLSLGQIGEFSFIIASLGLTLHVTSNFLYPVAVAVSVITTFTTPYLMKFSGPLAAGIERMLPQKWIDGLNRYSSSTEGIAQTSDWKMLLRAYLINFITHSVILTGILFLAKYYLYPFITTNIGAGLNGILIGIVISFILMAPFLWAFALRRIERKAYSHLWLNKRYSRGPLIAIEVTRILLAILYIGFLLNIFLNATWAIIIALMAIILAIIVFSKKLQAFYNRLETRFLLNLNDRENQREKTAIIPWEAHLAEMQVAPESPLTGKTLAELAIRERYGVSIALIERGKISIPTPNRDEQLFPYDKLTVIGTDEQLAHIKQLVEDHSVYSEDTQAAKKDLELQKITITAHSAICGQSIRDSGIRERTQGLIAAIERNNERIVNPDSSLVFQPGDTLWIVGNRKRIMEALS